MYKQVSSKRSYQAVELRYLNAEETRQFNYTNGGWVIFYKKEPLTKPKHDFENSRKEAIKIAQEKGVKNLLITSSSGKKINVKVED